MLPLLLLVVWLGLTTTALMFCSKKESSNSYSISETTLAKATLTRPSKINTPPSAPPPCKQQKQSEKKAKLVSAQGESDSAGTEKKNEKQEFEGASPAGVDEDLKFGPVKEEEEPRTTFDSLDENENPFYDNNIQDKLKNGTVGKKKSIAGTTQTRRSQVNVAVATNKSLAGPAVTTDGPEQTRPPIDPKLNISSIKNKATKTNRSTRPTTSKLGTVSKKPMGSTSPDGGAKQL